MDAHWLSLSFLSIWGLLSVPVIIMVANNLGTKYPKATEEDESHVVDEVSGRLIKPLKYEKLNISGTPGSSGIVKTNLISPLTDRPLVELFSKGDMILQSPISRITPSGIEFASMMDQGPGMLSVDNLLNDDIPVFGIKSMMIEHPREGDEKENYTIQEENNEEEITNESSVIIETSFPVVESETSESLDSDSLLEVLIDTTQAEIDGSQLLLSIRTSLPPSYDSHVMSIKDQPEIQSQYGSIHLESQDSIQSIGLKLSILSDASQLADCDQTQDFYVAQNSNEPADFELKNMSPSKEMISTSLGLGVNIEAANVRNTGKQLSDLQEAQDHSDDQGNIMENEDSVNDGAGIVKSASISEARLSRNTVTSDDHYYEKEDANVLGQERSPVTSVQEIPQETQVDTPVDHEDFRFDYEDSFFTNDD